MREKCSITCMMPNSKTAQKTRPKKPYHKQTSDRNQKKGPCLRTHTLQGYH